MRGRSKNKHGAIRVDVYLDPETKAMLETLESKKGRASKSEVLRLAIRLLYYADDKTLFVKDETGNMERILMV